MTRDDILLIAKRMVEERGGSQIDDEAELLRFAVVLGNRVAAAEREACAKVAESPVGEYEVTVACGTDPAPHRIPRYLDWYSIAAAIRARGKK